ncbi:hypothetical protein RSAG8_06414, partial [Rhizoctonia solani AG-8 WAC10335]
MEEASKKEQETAEFEARKREREEQSEAKTAKNRARRQKKKGRAMGKGSGAQDGASGNSEDPIKRRRLAADGANVVFRKPGESSDDEDEPGPIPVMPQPTADDSNPSLPPDVKIAEPTQIIIHDD